MEKRRHFERFPSSSFFSDGAGAIANASLDSARGPDIVSFRLVYGHQQGQQQDIFAVNRVFLHT
jgi:hypothetical protein